MRLCESHTCCKGSTLASAGELSILKPLQSLNEDPLLPKLIFLGSVVRKVNITIHQIVIILNFLNMFTY